jgi:ketosteroid isomerase-like protein
MSDATRDYFAAWSEWRFEPEACRALDDERVLMLYRFTGRGRSSGLEVGEIAQTAASVFHLRAGKVRRLVAYWDRDRALEDLGLAPDAPA